MITELHTFLISNLFAYFHFRFLFPFFEIENFFYHLVAIMDLKGQCVGIEAVQLPIISLAVK